MSNHFLPEDENEIGAFYKKAFDNQLQAPPSASFMDILNNLPTQTTSQESSPEKKSKLFSIFHPVAFRYAASLSSIIITNALVLGGSLAVVTVMSDYKIPEKMKIFSFPKKETESTTPAIESKKDTDKNPNLIEDKKPTIEKIEPKITTPQIQKSTKPEENEQVKFIENKKVEESPKEQSKQNTSPSDNKKLLEELKDDDLFK